MTEAEYFELIIAIIRVRGVGGKITRKELIQAMLRKYNPKITQTHAQRAIRCFVDIALIRLRSYNFLKSSERGCNIILEPLPNIDFSDFSAKYPLKHAANRERKSD